MFQHVIQAIRVEPSRICRSRQWRHLLRHWHLPRSTFLLSGSVLNLHTSTLCRIAGPPKRCYYAVLGVDVDASQAAIQSAYYLKCKETHPDTASKQANEVVDDTTKLFLAVAEAYTVLGDPTLRQAYDITCGRVHVSVIPPNSHSMPEDFFEVKPCGPKISFARAGELFRSTGRKRHVTSPFYKSNFKSTDAQQKGQNTQFYTSGSVHSDRNLVDEYYKNPLTPPTAMVTIFFRVSVFGFASVFVACAYHSFYY